MTFWERSSVPSTNEESVALLVDRLPSPRLRLWLRTQLCCRRFVGLDLFRDERRFLSKSIEKREHVAPRAHSTQ
jgi:hypothetical protein